MQCAGITWEPNGKTVAGGHGPGNSLQQLNSSYGVFVDTNGASFVTDYFNSRVVQWGKGASQGTLYVEGQCESSSLTAWCYPTTITFNKEGTLFITVQNESSGGVLYFNKGATVAETLITANTSLYGIAWDENEEFLYIGHHREHRVVKYAKDGTFVKVVAGGHGPGPALNQLDYRE